MSIFDKLKEIKNLREQAQKVKQELEQIEVSGSALGGKIKIVLSGEQEIKNLTIDESLLSLSQKSRLEKELINAFNKAQRQLKQEIALKIKEGGLDLPGL